VEKSGRRRRGNVIDAPHPAHGKGRAQTDMIAERQMRAFKLRKAGSSYPAIAQQLGVDVHTHMPTSGPELAGIRETNGCRGDRASRA